MRWYPMQITIWNKACPNRNYLAINLIKHCLVTKHADVEVSGQTVKKWYDQRQVKLLKQRTMDHKLRSVPQDFNMEECESSYKF